MVKVVAPMFSVDCRGNINQTICYSISRGVHVMKMCPKSAELPSQNQLNVRQVYSNGVGVWNDMTEMEKQVYVDRAEGRALIGFNIFIGEYIEANYPITEVGRFGTGKYGKSLYA